MNKDKPLNMHMFRGFVYGLVGILHMNTRIVYWQKPQSNLYWVMERDMRQRR